MLRTKTGSQRQNGSAGFTLIELLVVVAIMAVLMAILLPSLSRAREQAKVVACASNVRSIGQGMNTYAAEYSAMLPYAAFAPTTPPYGNSSWDGLIVALLGGTNPDPNANGIYDHDGPAGYNYIAHPPKWLACPSDIFPRTDSSVLTNYPKAATAIRSYSMPSTTTGYPIRNVYGVGRIGGYAGSFVSGSPYTNSVSCVKITQVDNASQTLLLAENWGASNASGGFNLTQPNVAGTSSQAYISSVLYQSPCLNSGTVAMTPSNDVHFQKFSYGYVDGHAESMSPMKTVRIWGFPSDSGGMGSWAYQADYK